MFEVKVKRSRYMFSFSQSGAWEICNNGNVIGQVKIGQTAIVRIEEAMGLIHLKAGGFRSNAVLVSEDEGDVSILVQTWLHGAIMFLALLLLPWISSAIEIKKEILPKLP